MRFTVAATAALPLASYASPLLHHRAPSVEGKYLVVLKPGSNLAGTGSTESVLSTLVGGLIASIPKDHIYQHGSFRGFAGALSGDQVAALRADPSVAYVEPDGVARTQQQGLNTQSQAPWGLGRISHRAKGSTDYLYDATSGAGTCAYIVDTGIYVQHPEFEGRATMVKSYTGVDTDDNGHGTHVSGTIASKSYGVSKKASLYGIKVLDASGSGTWSDIISGIGVVVSDSKQRSCPNGSFFLFSPKPKTKKKTNAQTLARTQVSSSTCLSAAASPAP
jgi:subtilisin family serine protease